MVTVTAGEMARLRAWRDALLRERVLENPWIPHRPTPPQAAFLTVPAREALYGGAAGGGKSDALLMAALMYVDVPGYAALIIRRNLQDLILPGALIPRSHEWLGGSEARWNDNKKQWTFPSGATLTFGYLQNPNDHLRYQGAEFHYVAFDELTQLREHQYRYLFSRTRRLEGMDVPIRVRAATNPGGPGHAWVRRRFIEEGPRAGRVFVPARLTDNPYLDHDQYVAALGELDEVTRAQLLHGRWDAGMTGRLFRREWFRTVIDRHEVPRDITLVRFWDLAATEAGSGPDGDPDWTVGALVGWHAGVYYLVDLRRVRKSPMDVEDLVRETAAADGPGVYIYMEQEPGASGKALIDYYARHVLPGYPFWGVPSTGSKEHRAAPLSAAAERGHVVLVRGDWSISDFLDEAEAFPWGEHDDQIDAVSGAVQKLRELAAGAVAVPQAAQGTAYTLGVITGGRRLLRP